jgi:uncharacterized Ntn-hydrolase superfamily protein
MKKLYPFLILILLSFGIKAQDTFSIIAVDPVTGDIGSIGASCVTGASGAFDTWVTDIIPGKGGVNAQAWICLPNINLQNAMARMEEGLSPQEIIDWLLLNDACSSQNYDPEYRQYGIVDLDMNGDPRSAGWTGSMADDYKEDRQGVNYSVQGNILLDQSVIDNMEDNFNNTSGTLADKLMSSLQGANFPGADSRCLANGTSSRAAWFVVYRADDEPGEPYLRLVVPTQSIGVEPIDILQDMYDDFLAVTDFNMEELIHLYPNPVDDELVISYNPSLNVSELEIYDINGRRVKRIDSSILGDKQQTIDVSSLQSGIYFINMATIKGSHSMKFVKK